MAKGKIISVQVTTEIDEVLTSYEKKHDCTRSKAVRHFLELGIEKHQSGIDAPVTKADLLAAVETLSGRIKEQPIQVQAAALPEPDQAAKEEREKIANMGFFARRRYLQGEMKDRS